MATENPVDRSKHRCMSPLESGRWVFHDFPYSMIFYAQIATNPGTRIDRSRYPFISTQLNQEHQLKSVGFCSFTDWRPSTPGREQVDVPALRSPVRLFLRRVEKRDIKVLTGRMDGWTMQSFIKITGLHDFMKLFPVDFAIFSVGSSHGSYSRNGAMLLKIENWGRAEAPMTLNDIDITFGLEVGIDPIKKCRFSRLGSWQKSADPSTLN